MEKIHDDMEEYVLLCEYFREKPKTKPDFYGNQVLDCYGKHAKELANRKAEKLSEEIRNDTKSMA